MQNTQSARLPGLYAWRLLGPFAWNQILSCLFPVGVFASLALSKVVQIPGLPRYDFVLLLCIAIQIAMVCFRLESVDELKVICVFHLIGLAMEIYKTQIGSWSYPGFAYSKVGPVPLYSGFMYASVASYMCQAWRRFDLSILRMPRPWLSLGIAGAVYANFFTNHYIWDLRWPLFLAVLIAFWRTRAEFTVAGRPLWMPICLSFFLIGFFVWVAENIVTSLSGWAYPHQLDGWEPVGLAKMTSWALLVIVSFVLVEWLKSRKSARLPYNTTHVSSSPGSPSVGRSDLINLPSRDLRDGVSAGDEGNVRMDPSSGVAGPPDQRPE